jgi:hypothetical protein
MKKYIGAKFKALWRLKPDEFVESGDFEWSTGKIYSYDADKDVLSVFLDEVNKDPKYLILYEFPHEEVEYSAVKILRESKMPQPVAKRDREPEDVTPSPSAPSAQLSELAHAFLDGKAQKATQFVDGGEGFRIPASIQEKYNCLHPTSWWPRKVSGEDPETLSNKVVSDLSALQSHLGALQPTVDMRDAINEQVKIIRWSVKLPLSDRPKCLEQWLEMFAAPLMWLRLVLTVAYGQQIATTVFNSASSAMRKGGLLDLADLITTAEETALKEKTAGDFRATQTVANEVKRMVANAVAGASHPTQEPAGGARGRGGWRGRGRGGYRGQL